MNDQIFTSESLALLFEFDSKKAVADGGISERRLLIEIAKFAGWDTLIYEET